MPILARCKRCGRGFLSIGTAKPWVDAYYPVGVWPTKKHPDVEVCGGTIELTEAGRRRVEEESAAERIAAGDFKDISNHDD